MRRARSAVSLVAHGRGRRSRDPESLLLNSPGHDSAPALRQHSRGHPTGGDGLRASPVSHPTRTSTTRCATAGRPARDPVSQAVTQHASTGTPRDLPPRARFPVLPLAPPGSRRPRPRAGLWPRRGHGRPRGPRARGSGACPRRAPVRDRDEPRRGPSARGGGRGWPAAGAPVGHQVLLVKGGVQAVEAVRCSHPSGAPL